MIIVDGDEAANIVAERLAAEPVIEVRDKDDRRVPGAVVRFVIRKTRDRLIASFGNGQAEMRTLTDYSGRASVNAVTPVEPGSFQIDVEVSYRGQTGKAVIRQTNFPTSADAKAAGREPGKSTNSNAQTSTTGAASTVATGATTAATSGATAATTAAVRPAAGCRSWPSSASWPAVPRARARPSCSRARKASLRRARSALVAASSHRGLQSSTAFTFSVQATGFEAGTSTTAGSSETA